MIEFSEHGVSEGALSDRILVTYVRIYTCTLNEIEKTTQTGLEPVTSAVTGRRSNQLSHWAKKHQNMMSLAKMDLRGLEPRTDRL